jgi:hypothetical protein
VQNANPIILDSNGQANIWLSSAIYKFTLQNSAGVQQWSIDGISWSTPLSTFNGLVDTGDFTMQQSTAATSGANQNSNNFKIQANFWDSGSSTSKPDTCTWTNTAGTGSNPNMVLTLNCSGSSGTHTYQFNLPLSLNSNNLTNTGTGSQFTGAWETLSGSQSFTFGSTSVSKNSIAVTGSPLPDASTGGTPGVQWTGLGVDWNALDYAAEQIAVGRTNRTQDAIAGGIFVPSTQTAISQLDALAGYIRNEGAGPDPVAVYGQARANYNTAPAGHLYQSWAANLLCSDTVGMTQSGSCYGLEIDINKNTSNLGGWAMDFNGNVATGTYGGLLYVKPGAGQWNPAIDLGVGASPAVDGSGNGGIILEQLASGNSQGSQGIGFVSQDGSAVKHYMGIAIDANGNFTIGVPTVATRLRVNAAVASGNDLARLRFDFGSNLVVGDFGTLDANWGNTASIAVNGQDGNGVAIVTANGAGIGANPKLTLTFHDGAWPTAPLTTVTRCDGNAPTTAYWYNNSNSTTTMQITFLGTPVGGSSYCATFQNFGKN